MQVSQSQPRVPMLAALVLLSWLGAYIHTTFELQLPVWRPENSFPLLVGAALFLGWWKGESRRRMWTWLLLI
jgi:hypothetical protein